MLQTNAIHPKRPLDLAALIEQRDKDLKDLGFTPMSLDTDVLLRRVADGGHSGQYLADAFISAYRLNIPFNHGLSELIKLDAEAFRLFHQILHIRHISGWTDEGLYQIEQQILAMVGGDL